MVLAAIVSAALALVICLAAAPLGRALGVLDIPDGRRKRHPRATPLTGGLAVALPVALVVTFLAVRTAYTPFYLTVAVALVAFFLLGFFDDRRHMRPLYRLALSSALALAVLLVVPAERVSFFRLSFLDVAVFLDAGGALVLTVLCLVGLQNALNMADGRNGIAAGLLLVWTLLAAAYAPAHVLPILAAFAAALAVALAFNLRGRLFLGDSGTYGLSIALGLIVIHVYVVSFESLHADVVALWFLVPVVDALRLMVMRMLAGGSPFTPDRGHFHDFLAARFAWPAALAFYLCLVAVPGVLAWAAPAWTVLWALAALLIYSVVVVTGLWDPGARRLRLRPRQG